MVDEDRRWAVPRLQRHARHPNLVFSQSIRHGLLCSLVHAGSTLRSSDKSNSPSIVLRRSILHKRDNDDGNSRHNRPGRSLPMRGWLLPMPVSQNRLRSEKNARCPLLYTSQLPVGSLGRAHQSRKRPCYLPCPRRTFILELIIRVVWFSCCANSTTIAVQY